MFYLPISVYSGGLHADAMQKLHDGKVLNENFLKEINNPQSLIIEFCNHNCIVFILFNLKTMNSKFYLNF